MRQCHCSYKGMGAGIWCWIGHFHECKKVLSGTISAVQCSSSRGTVGKSSSISEYTSVLPGSWSSSELWEVNDRQWHTGMVGVHGKLWCVMVAGLQGVVCAGLKDACSMLDMWSM